MPHVEAVRGGGDSRGIVVQIIFVVPYFPNLLNISLDHLIFLSMGGEIIIRLDRHRTIHAGTIHLETYFG